MAKIKFYLGAKLGELNLYQAGLARATGIRAATISHMRNNVLKSIKISQLESICDVLGCDLHDIMRSERTENSKGE